MVPERKLGHLQDNGLAGTTYCLVSEVQLERDTLHKFHHTLSPNQVLSIHGPLWKTRLSSSLIIKCIFQTAEQGDLFSSC